jgi:type IV secretion system protein TrbL
MVSTNALTGIYNTFSNHGAAVQAALQVAALEIFGTLALIEIVFSVGWAIVHKTDIMDILALVTRHMITIGFFFWLMTNWTAFAANIISGGAAIGGKISTAGGGAATLSPIDIMQEGINIFSHIMTNLSLMHPVESWFLGCAAAWVMIIYIFIGIETLALLLESFIASYVGVIMLAFGANAWTRDLAVSQTKYAISVGVKRLTMQVIIGFSSVALLTWSQQISNNPATVTWQDIGVMMSFPLVVLLLTLRVPNILAGVIHGSHVGQGASLFSASAQLGRTITQAAASITGAGAAVTAAVKASSAAMGVAQAAGTAPHTRIGQAAQMARTAASIAGKEVAADVGGRLTGQYNSTHGYAGWRVARNITQAGKKD